MRTLIRAPSGITPGAEEEFVGRIDWPKFVVTLLEWQYKITEIARVVTKLRNEVTNDEVQEETMSDRFLNGFLEQPLKIEDDDLTQILQLPVVTTLVLRQQTECLNAISLLYDTMHNEDTEETNKERLLKGLEKTTIEEMERILDRIQLPHVPPEIIDLVVAASRAKRLIKRKHQDHQQ